MDAMIAIRESDLVAQPDKNISDTVKAFTVTNTNNIPGATKNTVGTWVSVLPDGSLSSSDDLGQYQVCYRSGSDPRVFWNCAGVGPAYYPTGSYGLPLAVGL